jgi:hypothetical protein
MSGEGIDCNGTYPQIFALESCREQARGDPRHVVLLKTKE